MKVIADITDGSGTVIVFETNRAGQITPILLDMVCPGGKTILACR